LDIFGSTQKGFLLEFNAAGIARPAHVSKEPDATGD
jgi:hypothetical protein